MSKITGSDPVGNPLTNLTYNEAHSMLLGLLGVFAGLGAITGFTHLVAYGSVVLIGLVFGFNSILYRVIREQLKPKLPQPVKGNKGAIVSSKASKVIAGEPWYFTTVYVLSFIGSAGFLLYA